MRQGLRFPPGEGWAYSNTAYLLIRRIIERLSGVSLGATLEALVFRPAGLRRTTVAATLADVQNLTPGFSAQLDDDGALHDIARRYHPGWVSHGVAISTAPDLARFIEALFDGRLLTPRSLTAMLEATPVPATHPLVSTPGYGLGLMVDLGSPYGRAAGHAGGGPGYSAAAFHVPDVIGRRLTSATLVNRDVPDLGSEIAFALVAAYADRCGPRSSERRGDDGGSGGRSG